MKNKEILEILNELNEDQDDPGDDLDYLEPCVLISLRQLSPILEIKR